MKKPNSKKWRLQFKAVNLEEIDDRLLLINLYATQIIALFIAFIIILFQKQSLLALMTFPETIRPIVFGVLFASCVLLADLLLSRFIPEEFSDDGGMNDKLFRNRPVWHIAAISLVVAVCEELLFRGAIQHAWGPYWTSILFAAIHVRYLKHWIPTGMVFAISYGLGWLYIHTGSLWAPIAAHFVVDFVLGTIIRYRRES